MRSLSELVTKADLIARVSVLSEYGDPTWTRRTGYRRVARARVTDALSGAVRNDVILLYYDTGEFCPNVSYRQGDDVLLFAYRTRRGYAAIYWSTGAMRLRRNSMRHDLFPKGARYEDVRNQIESVRHSILSRGRP